jgi:GGDEF domain-containing protein
MAMMTSSANGEGLMSAFFQPWLIGLVVVGAGFFVIGLIWRRRKVNYAVTKGLYGNWHTAIPRYRRSLHRMTGELERARRYGNSLTVAVLSVDQEQLKQKKRNLLAAAENLEVASYFFFSLISALLRDNLRNCDMLTYDVTNDYYVILMPETSATLAEQAVIRLNELVANRIKISLRFGIAEFPTDGLTIEDLVNHAHTRSHRKATENPPQKDAARSSQGAQRRESLAK